MKHNPTAYRYRCELERWVCQCGVSRFDLHPDLHAVDKDHNVAITLTHSCAGFMMHNLTQQLCQLQLMVSKGGAVFAQSIAPGLPQYTLQ